MSYKWTTAIARILVISLILGTIISTVMIVVARSSSYKIIEDRLMDLCQIVVDENCIDRETGKYDAFNQTLLASNTTFLTFTRFEVTDERGKGLYSYVDAPQKYKPITCKIYARISVRLFIPGVPEVFWNVDMDYPVMGQRFYKGK